jgi:hypothetical protein
LRTAQDNEDHQHFPLDAWFSSAYASQNECEREQIRPRSRSVNRPAVR